MLLACVPSEIRDFCHFFSLILPQGSSIEQGKQNRVSTLTGLFMEFRSEARTGVQSGDCEGAGGMLLRIHEVEPTHRTRFLTHAALYAAADCSIVHIHE